MEAQQGMSRDRKTLARDMEALNTRDYEVMFCSAGKKAIMLKTAAQRKTVL